MKKKWIFATLASSLVLSAAAVYIGAFGKLHVPAKAEKGQTRVACVGDSITYGFLLRGQPRKSYPDLLAEKLGSDFAVGNFGATDRTALKSGNKPYTKEKIYEKSLAFDPQIVVLMLGTNDTKAGHWDAEKYEHDLRMLVRRYKGLPHVRSIILLSPTPLFPLGERLWKVRASVLQEEVLPIVQRVAAEERVRYIDMHAAFEGQHELFVDGCHPNSAGAQKLAEIVDKAILQEEQREAF